MYIGNQVKTTLVIIIPNIIQRSITKIPPHSSYSRQISYMFCNSVLNSHNPSHARVQTHIQASALREPLR
jgi:hypothetical protein